MKQLRISVLLVLLSLQSLCQEKTDTTHTIYKNNNSFALRAKFLVWPIFFTAAETGIGFEYGFKKKYAVGLQAEYGFLSFPNDSDDKVGPRMVHVFKSASLTLKRYIRPTFYLAAFTRYGTFNFDIEKGYRTDTISYHQSQYSVGALVGFVRQANVRILYELNFGPFLKQIYVHDVYYQDNIIMDKRFHYLNFGLRVDVTFTWNFKMQSNHMMVPGEWD